MKLFIFMALFLQTQSQAYGRSSFTPKEYYQAEGRWLHLKEKYYFRVNEGTGNEEALLFLNNALDLKDKVKYKLCFKLINCKDTCSAEAVKKIKMLEPWKEARVLHMNSSAQYLSVTRSACQEDL